MEAKTVSFPASHLGDAHAPLHLRIIDMLADVGVFEHTVGFFKAFVQIAPRLFDGRAEGPFTHRQITV